ncbi:MAG: hypothetical protein SOU51_00925 [Collinsella sp.]|nr:hypothetical protein [Collinsella sp.]
MQAPDQIVVSVRDATYRRGAYRSFAHVSLDLRRGIPLALLSFSPAPVRDLLLALVGVVEPTSGSCVLHIPRGGLLHGTGAGIGVVSGIWEPDPSWTVGEALRREPASSDEVDDLEFLALLSLATEFDRRIGDLDPAARGRFSAALALRSARSIAAVDLTDPFIAGIPFEDLLALMGDIVALSVELDIPCVVGTSEPRAAVLAPSAHPLDIPEAEALERLGYPSAMRREGPDHA